MEVPTESSRSQTRRTSAVMWDAGGSGRAIASKVPLVMWTSSRRVGKRVGEKAASMAEVGGRNRVKRVAWIGAASSRLSKKVSAPCRVFRPRYHSPSALKS